MREDGSPIWNEKVANSKISGYVWTGPFKTPYEKRTVLMATWSVFYHLIVSVFFFVLLKTS